MFRLESLSSQSIRLPIFALIFAATALSPAWSQALLPQTAYGMFGGWYQPSLAKANAALEYAKQKLSGIGDDEFGGNLAIGLYLERRITRRWVMRAEAFYWRKNARQTVSSARQDDDASSGEGRAVIRLIPISINVLHYSGNRQSFLSAYGGMGSGLALTKLRVQAWVEEVDTLRPNVFSRREIFFAEDNNWGLLLQFLLGVRCRVAASVSFFAEARFITGQFRVQDSTHQIDEQILLSGVKLVLGIQLAWGQ